MKYSLKTHYTRAYIRFKNRALASKDAKILASMDSNQLKTFQGILKLCKSNPEGIRYDKLTGETLIILKDVIITLIDNKVDTYNHQGFAHQWFTDAQYKFFITMIDIEAHRYRRRLKFEVRTNLNKFLDELFKNHDTPE